MNLQKAGTIGLGLLLAGEPVYSHHSFSAEFDASKPVTLNGTVTKVEWLNPHAHVYIDVKPPAGPVATWEFELPSPNVLMRQGWTRDSLKRGDALIVSGYLAKDSSHVASARTIRFQDGRVVALGATGDGGPGR